MTEVANGKENDRKIYDECILTILCVVESATAF